MSDAPFYERFRALLQRLGLRPEEAATIMETGVDSVRRLADGRTKQMKLDEALRLCDRYDLDPWELAFGRPRGQASSPSAPADRLQALEERVDLLTQTLARMAGSSASAAEQVVEDLEAGSQWSGKERRVK